MTSGKECRGDTFYNRRNLCISRSFYFFLPWIVIRDDSNRTGKEAAAELGKIERRNQGDICHGKEVTHLYHGKEFGVL